MSLYFVGFGAGAALSYSAYRYVQNLKNVKNGITVDALAGRLQLNHEFDFVCLVDTDLSGEMRDIAETCAASGSHVCMLHLRGSSDPDATSHKRLRMIYLNTEADPRGVVIEGTAQHRDDVIMALFAHVRGTTHLVIDTTPEVTRWKSADVGHVTTADELRTVLLTHGKTAVARTPEAPSGGSAEAAKREFPSESPTFQSIA